MREAELWDQRYASSEHLFSAEPDAALVELVTPLPPGRALDLGCGEGRNSLWLARQGWAVLAVDVSGVALHRLREAARQAGLHADAVQAEITDHLARRVVADLVVIANLHPSPGERQALLRAAAAAVAPGGHLYLIGHHRDSLGIVGPSDPARLYSEGEVRDALPGLTLLRLERRVRRRRTEGELPAGLGVGPSSAAPVDLLVWAVAPR